MAIEESLGITRQGLIPKAKKRFAETRTGAGVSIPIQTHRLRRTRQQPLSLSSVLNQRLRVVLGRDCLVDYQVPLRLIGNALCLLIQRDRLGQQ